MENQVSVLLDDPTLDVVLGWTQPLQCGEVSGAGSPPLAQSGITVHLGSAVFRRRVFDTVGAFDERLTYSEDHDWFLRARELGIRMAQVEAVMLFYRRHGANMTRHEGHHGYELARVLKASLDRRRARAAAVRPLPKLSDYR